MAEKKWIQATGLKRGALSRQLGIAEKEDIPKTLLDAIIRAKAGQRISNPTKVGRPCLKVTRLMERRAIMARNLKEIAKSRKKKK